MLVGYRSSVGDISVNVAQISGMCRPRSLGRQSVESRSNSVASWSIVGGW